METTNDIGDSLSLYNKLYRELDKIYHDYAKSCGISDCAFWILYSLCEAEGDLTQGELCDRWFYSRQTVNSALKNMERQGVITLEPVAYNKRSKKIALTPKGRELTDRYILTLMDAEVRAFRKMGRDKLDRFIALTKENIGLLNEEIKKQTAVYNKQPR